MFKKLWKKYLLKIPNSHLSFISQITKRQEVLIFKFFKTYKSPFSQQSIYIYVNKYSTLNLSINFINNVYNCKYNHNILYYSHLCTEQLIYVSALSKLRESADISAVRYTNLNGRLNKKMPF